MGKFEKNETLKVLEAEVDFLKKLLMEKEKQLLDARLETIASFFATNLEDVVIGDHDCKDSPIGTCFYDWTQDSAWDNCLVCGEPDERK